MNMLVGTNDSPEAAPSLVRFYDGLGRVEKHNMTVSRLAEGAHSHDYALNKSGIIAWTRHAASYYGRYGVRVNTLCPGGLASDRTPARFSKNYGKHTQLGRLANEYDIRGPLLFLASDASAYITGVSIPVDGGYTCI